MKGVSMTINNPKLTLTFLGEDVSVSTITVTGDDIEKGSITSTFQLFSSLKSSSRQYKLTLKRKSKAQWRASSAQRWMLKQFSRMTAVRSFPDTSPQTIHGLYRTRVSRTSPLRLRTTAPSSSVSLSSRAVNISSNALSIMP